MDREEKPDKTPLQIPEDAVAQSAGGRAPVEYRETVGYGIWFHLLILLLVVLYAAVMIGILVGGEGSALMMTLFAVVEIVLLALYINFWRLKFEITGSEVRFGFGIIKKRFPRDRIVSCKPYELSFRNYYGYGIRSGLDGTIAYNTRNGPGIKLEIEGARKPYVVAINDPEKACRILSRI